MKRSLLLVAAVAALAALALLWLGAVSTGSTETVRSALSPQGCVTSCQTQQTDCILQCDGVVPCEKKCVVSGERCVRGCLATADAGTPRP
ncbi:MAG: hypothetical protein ABW217_03790 [Polyangiaceae bacterium]